MPRKSPGEDAVVAGLQRLLRRGLPVTPASADTVLLNLRGIVARAVDPADEASRTAALDGTLRGVLARFPDTRYASAARALFGLPPAEPGQNLTVRRDLAAELAGHEVHHFRKRVEPKLIEKIAWELLADADRFIRSPMIAPRLAPATARQPVHADPFAWEVAEHEEQLSRFWSAIYAARAELLAVERLLSLQADRLDVITTALTAGWRWAAARAETIRYTTAFAPELESSVDELVALAGWTPPLTPAQVSQLTEAAAGAASRDQFTAALHGETGLGSVWAEGFLAVKELGRLMTARPPGAIVRAHEMGIYKRYFDLIASGRKTTEIRVNDSSRKKIKKGSLIRFRCQGDQILTRVARVARYANFGEMFDHEEVASVNPLATRDEQLANIRQIYPPEREALGVVAIGIELIDPPRTT